VPWAIETARTRERDAKAPETISHGSAWLIVVSSTTTERWRWRPQPQPPQQQVDELWRVRERSSFEGQEAPTTD